MHDVVRTSHLLCYSGGQQRRVSFAVALMHDPELLILDEPTVGVDPLLRQSIWNHLVQITKDGNKTVIITTHYIEEARQAHTVSDIYCELMGFRTEGSHHLGTHSVVG